MSKKLNRAKWQYLRAIVAPLAAKARFTSAVKALETAERKKRRTAKHQATRNAVLAKWLSESIRNPILAPKKVKKDDELSIYTSFRKDKKGKEGGTHVG